jgi:hypothetical protein
VTLLRSARFAAIALVFAAALGIGLANSPVVGVLRSRWYARRAAA